VNDELSRINALEGDGWKKQFTACEPRLSEAVEMYRQAGFEVHLEPLPTANHAAAFPGEKNERIAQCRTCYEGFEAQYKIIFTRRRKTQPSDDESLF
jgi:hypothetical protein